MYKPYFSLAKIMYKPGKLKNIQTNDRNKYIVWNINNMYFTNVYIISDRFRTENMSNYSKDTNIRLWQHKNIS